MAIKRKAAAHTKNKKKSNTDFAAVFSRVREVMKSYDSLYNTTTDTPKRYYLETKDGRYRGKPVMFASSCWARRTSVITCFRCMCARN